MVSEIMLVSLTERMRLTILYAHLLACAFAISDIIMTDLAIVMGKYSSLNFANGC